MATTGRTRTAYPSGPPFIGREADVERLAATLERSEGGSAGSLVLWGEPGIGKTRLLREGVLSARAAGRHILWVRANPVEAQVPYGALTVALDEAVAAEPQLASEIAVTRESLDLALGASVARTSFGQACAAVTRLLAQMAALGPTSVAVDDVYLLDYESVALLSVVFERLGSSVAFVCTVRSLPYPLSSESGQLLSRIAASPGSAELRLRPLGADQVAGMLEHLVGGHVDPRVAELVARRAAGNPLFVLEVGRMLIDAGAVDADAAIAELPRSRHSAILQRIYPLARESRLLAQVVAVFRRLTLDQLSAVGSIASLDEGEVSRAFDELDRNQILVEDEAGSWGFFHPFAADALYEDIGPAERKRIHRAIVERRLTARSANDAAGVLELAWHVSESAEFGDRSAIAILREAAELTRNFAPETAARYCQKALELIEPGSSESAELLDLLARCYVIANRVPLAVEAGTKALAALPAGLARLRVVTAVVGSLYDVGRVHDAVALADREAEAGARSPFLDAQRAALRAAVGEVEAARVHVDQALNARPLTDGESVLVYGHAASAAAVIGSMNDFLSWTRRSLEAGERAGEGMAHYARARGAWMFASCGFLGEVRELLEATEVVFEDSAAYPAARLVGVLMDWLGGEWDRALRDIEASRLEIEASGNAVVAAQMRLTEADIRLWRGEIHEALALLDQPGFPGYSAASAWVIAAAQRALGNTGRARDNLEEATLSPAGAAWAPHVLARLVEVQLEAGDHAAAADTLAELRARTIPACDPRPWGRVLTLRSAALVEHDPSAAAEAATVAAAEGLRFEAALSQLVRSELDQGEVSALVAAHETFRLLGVDHLRRRSATLLKQRNAKVPRKRRREPGTLTEAEVQIARLVQVGLRNKEIAEMLHYSERTVEVYLSRIYATLGVTSRLQLARLLDTSVGVQRSE